MCCHTYLQQAVGNFELDLPPSALMSVAALILRQFADRAVNVHLDGQWPPRRPDGGDDVAKVVEGDASDSDGDLLEGGAAHSQQIDVRLRRLYLDLLDVFAKRHVDFGVKVEQLEVALSGNFSFTMGHNS